MISDRIQKKTNGSFLTKEREGKRQRLTNIHGRGKFYWEDARVRRVPCFSFYDWCLGLKCFHDGCVACFFHCLSMSSCHCARLAELGCSLKASRLGMIVAELNG